LNPDPAFHLDADPDPALLYPDPELPAANIDEKNLTTKM
jgi:hypothetical protein